MPGVAKARDNLTFLTASSTVHSSDTHSLAPISFFSCSTSNILVCSTATVLELCYWCTSPAVHDHAAPKQPRDPNAGALDDVVDYWAPFTKLKTMAAAPTCAGARCCSPAIELSANCPWPLNVPGKHFLRRPGAQRLVQRPWQGRNLWQWSAIAEVRDQSTRVGAKAATNSVSGHHAPYSSLRGCSKLPRA